MKNKYRVDVKNDILGNSSRIMTKSEISSFNLVALILSDKVDKDGQLHTSGMWTVSKYDS